MNVKASFFAHVVGTPVERIEDLRLLRGRGQFVDDLQREGMLHAAILRSPIAHGRFRSINASVARAMPGVRGVFTGDDIAQGSIGCVYQAPGCEINFATLPSNFGVAA